MKNMTPKEMTILIQKKSIAGKKEVEEMMKCPLTQEQIEYYIKINAQMLEFIELLKRME